MKKALHSSFHHTRFKALVFEIIQDFVVNIISICTIADALESDLLSLRDAVVSVFQSFRRMSSNDSARNIAKIAGFLRTGEDVHNDGSVCANRPTALIVRVHALIARSDDSVTRHVPGGHDCCVDNPFENLRSQMCSIKIYGSIFPNLAAPARVDSRLRPHYSSP